MRLRFDVPVWLNEIPGVPFPASLTFPSPPPRDGESGEDTDGARRGSVTLSLHDILGTKEWHSVVFSNYMTDLDWLARQLPGVFAPTSRTQIGVLYGEEDPSHLMAAAKLHGFANRLTFMKRPALPVAYGTHHTKAIFAFSDDLNSTATAADGGRVAAAGVRVAILTSNFIHDDVLRKNQAFYVEDFPLLQRPPAGGGASAGGGSGGEPPHSDFGVELTRYLTAACGGRLLGPLAWLDRVDFSGASVRLVASVPGYHQGQDAWRWGQGRLRRVLEAEQRLLQHPPCRYPHHRTLVFQYSSQGSLTDKFIGDLRRAMTPPTSSAAISLAAWSTSPKKRPGTADGSAPKGARVESPTTAGVGAGSSLAVASAGRSSSATHRQGLTPMPTHPVAAHQRAGITSSPSAPTSSSLFKVVLPTQEEVRSSVEGWRGGLSIPVYMKNFHETVNAALHRFTPAHFFRAPTSGATSSVTTPPPTSIRVECSSHSDDENAHERYRQIPGRHRAMPHIKTYCALIEPHHHHPQTAGGSRSGVESDHHDEAPPPYAEWVVYTSSNLSRAAWGDWQKKDTQLMIRSYELGVVVTPSSSSSSSSAGGRFSLTPNAPLLPLGDVDLAEPDDAQLMAELQLAYGAHPVLIGAADDAAAGEPARKAAWLPYCVHDLQRYTPPNTPVPPRDVPWAVDFPHSGSDVLGQDATVMGSYSHYGEQSWTARELSWQRLHDIGRVALPAQTRRTGSATAATTATRVGGDAAARDAGASRSNSGAGGGGGGGAAGTQACPLTIDDDDDE